MAGSIAVTRSPRAGISASASNGPVCRGPTSLVAVQSGPTRPQATWRWRPGVAVFVAGDNLGQRVQTARDANGVFSYGPPTTLRIGLKLGL